MDKNKITAKELRHAARLIRNLIGGHYQEVLADCLPLALDARWGVK